MRYALAVEYNGSKFCGWQRQKHCKSVQSVVETALSEVANEPIELTCAGRTDAGVHAIAQFVHFDTNAVRPDKAWSMGTNALMEKSVSVHWVSRVNDDFHARYNAIGRRYRYIIFNRKSRPALESGRMTWVHQHLDADAMHAAGKYLVGEHDFSAFRAAGCQAKHAIRKINSLTVHRDGEKVIVEVSANAFLHNMVRIITGNLIRVGKYEVSPDWIGELLEKKDRTLGGITADPDGLYFLGAQYPEQYNIPDFSTGWRTE